MTKEQTHQLLLSLRKTGIDEHNLIHIINKLPFRYKGILTDYYIKKTPKKSLGVIYGLSRSAIRNKLSESITALEIAISYERE